MNSASGARSITARLTSMNMLVSGAALALACMVFIGYDQLSFRQGVVRTLSAQAQIVGANSISALTFNDPDSAVRTLGTLHNSPTVRLAAIYTPDGRLFAQWTREAGAPIPAPRALPKNEREKSWFEGGEVVLARNIVFEDNSLGVVYVVGSLAEMHQRLLQYSIIAGIVWVLSLGLALLVSGGVRRAVADPIVRLAALARSISRQPDFAIRAPANVETQEIGALIGAFNEMLVQIQRRDTALQEHARETLATLQSIPQIVWTASADGDIQFMNQRWFEYTGLPPDSSPELFSEYIEPSERESVTAAWQRSLDIGSDFMAEYRLRRRDGTYRWHFARTVPIRDEEGRIVRWFGSATDIHEQKMAETALVRSEKLAATGRMAATIAHEINNPLASITNAVHLLQTPNLPEQARKEMLDLLAEETARVGYIVKSTLGISRQTSTPSRVDPAQLLDQVLALFLRRYDSRDIQIVRRFEKTDEVTVLPSEIRQVMSNLLSNSLDVMPFGGKLTLAVHPAFDPANPERKGVRILISDTGAGIAPEARRNVFEPFFSTKADLGTGLGLWVSRNIIEKHGGTIRFRTRTEGSKTGTLFSIFLPYDALGKTQVA